MSGSSANDEQVRKRRFRVGAQERLYHAVDGNEPAGIRTLDTRIKSPKPHSSTGRYRGFQWLSVAKSDNALRSSGQQLDLKRYQNTITASLHNPSKPCEIKVDTTA